MGSGNSIIESFTRQKEIIMAYLTKEALLHAYKTISSIDENKQQGLTQKVSALRYLFALDRFYKKNGKNCDTKSTDKNEYVDYVGEIVKLSDSYYTSNFYTGLYTEQDYKVGSNFFSVNAVKDSLVNTTIIVDFPRRSKDGELFKIQNGVLLRDVSLFQHIEKYLPSVETRIAFALWIARNLEFEEIEYQELINVLKSRYSEELIGSLLPIESDFQNNFSSLGWLKLSNTQAMLVKSDILALFEKEKKDFDSDKYPLQQIIFFGAPGTGKSHEVKKQTGELLENGDEVDLPNVFRTTFHPDTDYASFVGCYKPTMKPTSKEEKTLTGKDEEIVYEFVPQVFTDAYVYAYNNSDQPTYLVIEEINRGNCAQIFGDLFQLLDRKNGKSEYKIKADKDLAQYLREKLGVDSEGIQDGKLCLPANLHILATMNTSDQSLFPMDSAFKRRWEWEYVPINYDTTIKSGEFEITIGKETGERKYSWVGFIEKVNEKIFDLTQSEDKQMGNFFIKQSIDEKGFKSKVMFYLWYEVLRDETENNKYFFYKKTTVEGKEVLSKFTFKDLFGDKATETLQQFMEYLEVAPK